MINVNLNRRLKQEHVILQQYLNLVDDKTLAVTSNFTHEADNARIDFLMFSLTNAAKILLADSSARSTLKEIQLQLNSIQQMLTSPDRNPKLCITKLEQTSSLWSELCY